MIYRLYFNRCEDFPQIWSIDEGTTETEINVSDFRFKGTLSTRGGRAPDFQVVNKARDPLAWVSIDAEGLSIEQGVAVFHAVVVDSRA